MRIALLLTLLAGVARADIYGGISVEELYDSNVENSRGPDAVSRISPRLGVDWNAPTWQLVAEYRAVIDEYALGTADGSFNHRAELDGTYHASPLTTLALHGIFLDASDPILIERPAVAIPNGPFVDLSAEADLDYRLSRRLTLDLDYQFRLSRFEDSAASDGDEHRGDARLTWRATRKLDLIATARAQKFVSYDAPDPGGTVGGMAGFGYALTPTWKTFVEGGPLAFLPNGFAPTTNMTWVGDARLVNTGRVTRVSLVLARDLYGGTGAQEAIWDESLYLQLVWQAGKHIWIHGRAGAYRSGNAPDGAAEVTGLDAAGEVGWIFMRGASRIELYGERRMQDANGGLAFGDITRTIVGLRFLTVAGGRLGDLP